MGKQRAGTGEHTPSGWARRWAPSLGVIVTMLALAGAALAVGHFMLPSLPWATHKELSVAQADAVKAIIEVKADAKAVREDCARRAKEIEARQQAQALVIQDLRTSSQYQDRLLWQVATRIGVPAPAPPQPAVHAAAP